MISRGDDYPLHQTSRPVRDPDVHRNLYDRFFFHGYPPDGLRAGATFFAVAQGQYPGRNVADASFSLIVDGVQHNVRASRLLGDDRLDLRVGPIEIEIIEPLHQLRVRVDDTGGTGIVADLTFTSRAQAFEEPHYRWAPGHRTVFDITRLTQGGTWSGTIEHGGRITDVSDWWGGRDRSWGIRPMGEPEVGAPDGPGRQFYWLWAPCNLPDECVLFDVNENSDGVRWHANAMSAPASSTQATVRKGDHSYAITWKPNTRHAAAFCMNLTYPSGGRCSYQLEPLLTFYMQGIGYGHPQWGHGRWVGPDERTHDEIDLLAVDETDPLFQHVQQLCRVRRGDGAVGMGTLEMLIIGPHAPSGFTSILDMHD